jgi:hypothetical protein
MTNFTKLIQEQTEIGWDQMMRGRWSTEWVWHLVSALPSQGEKRAITILTGIWKTVLKIWTARCDQQHLHAEIDPGQQRQELTQQIRAIYNQKPNFDLVDQEPITQPMNTIVSMPIPSIKRWITCIETFVKDYNAHAQEQKITTTPLPPSSDRSKPELLLNQ